MAFWRLFFVFMAVSGLTGAEVCPPFWTHFNGNCYRYFGPPKSWQEAMKHCHEFFASYAQGHLASIHDSEENAFLFQLWRTSARTVEGSANSHMWIGLNDRAQEGQYKWSDGTRFDFEAWISGNPSNSGNNEDCGELHIRPDETGWNDNVCTQRQSYICKMTMRGKGI